MTRSADDVKAELASVLVEFIATDGKILAAKMELDTATALAEGFFHYVRDNYNGLWTDVVTHATNANDPISDVLCTYVTFNLFARNAWIRAINKK